MQNLHKKRDFATRLKKLIRNFKDDSGATTVEFVLWVPVFMFILMITVDVSLMFLRQSNMWQVARDTARQVSIRQLATVADAEAYAQTTGTFAGDVPNVTVVIDNSLQFTRVMLRVPLNQVGIFGVMKIGGRLISIGGPGDLVAIVTHRLEPL